MAGAGGATAAVQPAAAGPGAGAAPMRSSSSSAGGAAGAGGGVADPRAEALRCPRCDSANTKFCYYNNYSLSQPRHFCKACKRYWTRGGTLRNVPVGGGCRKNKRSRSGNAAGANRGGGSYAAAAGAGAASSGAGGGVVTSSASSLSLTAQGSLTSALGGLHGGSSLASLLLGSGGGSGGDHLGLFQAMQSVVSDATAYEMHQQHQSQVDQLLGLGYGAGQIQTMKPWQHHLHDGAGGILDGFYAPLLSSSVVPGLEELHVKTEANVGRDHHHQQQHQQKVANGDQQAWELPTSSSNHDSSTITSDALMAAAASMNPPASSAATTAPASSQLMYWGNGGIGGGPAAWPDMANCGSSIATFF